MRECTVIEIDLSAVTRNMAAIRRIVGPECAICPVVKADAYGLGAVRIGKCLEQAGAEMLAVFSGDQAAELLRAALGRPVLVLMPMRELGRADELYRGLVRGQVHLSAHDPGHIEDLIRLSEQYALSLPVHLEVDTGMGRGGCPLDDVPEALARIRDARRLRLAGISSHFASAACDHALTDTQHGRFDRVLGAHAALVPPDCLVHVASTSAMLRRRTFHQSMVRVGQAWAGFGPENLRGRLLPGASDLQPAVTWSSRIVHLKSVAAGTPVGYGSRETAWTAPRDGLIGLVPVGYADGYPRALSEPPLGERPAGVPGARVAVLIETPAGLERVHVPIAGRVNMDQLTIDLTDLGPRTAELAPRLHVGTPIELITADRAAPNHLVTIAEAAGTNPHELLCRLSPRVRRVYHQSVANVEVFPAQEAAAAAAG